MTPKEKAKELCNKFLRTYKVSLFPPFTMASDEAKQCALIAVDEIIQTAPKLDKRNYKNNCSWVESLCNIDYWQEVKSEIEKL
jgi:hypothetical protein